MKYGKKINYGLYLISDRNILGGRDFIRSLEEAILGGVTVVQLREKGTDSLEFYNLATEVQKLTTRYGIPLIINDRSDIALAVNADGVHVGQSDIPADAVRNILGEDKIIGVSVATPEEAQKAVKDGADYVGAGALFSTNTKTNTRTLTLESLKDIKENIDIPVIGIGGIDEHNLGPVKNTGIDGIAVASAILGEKDIKGAAKIMHDIFFR